MTLVLPLPPIEDVQIRIPNAEGELVDGQLAFEHQAFAIGPNNGGDAIHEVVERMEASDFGRSNAQIFTIMSDPETGEAFVEMPDYSEPITESLLQYAAFMVHVGGGQLPVDHAPTHPYPSLSPTAESMTATVNGPVYEGETLPFHYDSDVIAARYKVIASALEGFTTGFVNDSFLQRRLAANTKYGGMFAVENRTVPMLSEEHVYRAPAGQFMMFSTKTVHNRDMPIGVRDRATLQIGRRPATHEQIQAAISATRSEARTMVS